MSDTSVSRRASPPRGAMAQVKQPGEAPNGQPGGPGPGGSSLSPNGLTFRDQGVFTVSPPKEVVLSNTGPAPISIVAVAVKGDFSQTNNCPKSLVPDSNCAIQVSFRPAATGLRTANLTVTFGGTTGALSATLAGNGVPAFTLSAEPEQATVVTGTDTTSFTIAVSSPYSFTQAVALGCAGDSTILCTFNPASVSPGSTSVMTVRNLSQTSSDSVAFDVMGSSAGQSASVPVSVMISDFGLTTATPEQTVHAGQQATFHVMVQAVNGFNHRIALACGGVPSSATCRVDPASVTPDGNEPIDVTVVVGTTAPSFAIPLPDPVGPSGKLWFFFVWFSSLGAFAAWWIRAERNGSLRKWLVACGIQGLALILLAGCGGGSGPQTATHRSGTAAGRYEFRITGTSGELVRTVSLTLRVD